MSALSKAKKIWLRAALLRYSLGGAGGAGAGAGAAVDGATGAGATGAGAGTGAAGVGGAAAAGGGGGHRGALGTAREEQGERDDRQQRGHGADVSIHSQVLLIVGAVLDYFFMRCSRPRSSLSAWSMLRRALALPGSISSTTRHSAMASRSFSSR